MKCLFEGSREQISLMESKFKTLLLRDSEIPLPELKENYQIENLWCTEDVKSNFDCNEADALLILEQALTNEATMQQIWFAISHYAEMRGLKRIQ